jgi:hypothetical protein
VPEGEDYPAGLQMRRLHQMKMLGANYGRVVFEFVFPNDALPHFIREVILEALKRYDAGHGLQRCRQLDPTHADGHFNLALAKRTS